MKKYAICILFIMVAGAGTGWGVSFFELEIASNVVQETEFDISGPVDNGKITLADGSSIGVYIGTEMALDFNMKLNFELGFHGGKYQIAKYYTDSGWDQPTKSEMSYYNYIFMVGIRLKYDFQITDSISIEPYILTGLTPLYMYTPSSYLSNTLDDDLGFTDNPSYNFEQSKIWVLDYFGIGFDIDFSQAAVEYSGSSKFKVGLSYRTFDRDVKFHSDIEASRLNLLCLTGTVLF
jgi:hypothetical protein